MYRVATSRAIELYVKLPVFSCKTAAAGHHAELSINPLASRIVRLLDGSNFKEFVRLLAAFSGRASQEKKLKFMFEVCYTATLTPCLAFTASPHCLLHTPQCCVLGFLLAGSLY